WEAFFRKVFANPSLGILKDEKFIEPPTLSNDMGMADPSIYVTSENPEPRAEGQDAGVGSEQDYMRNNEEYIGPESKPFVEEKPEKPVKDTVKKEQPKAVVTEEPKKKQNIFKKIFGKKQNKGEQPNTDKKEKEHE
ncbi:MAG TPA: penicillin-binding protein, partial [Niabella sp.]|nr:penicillin-binding protein [Niabella sp.]